MTFVNYIANEVIIKIVYCGPSLGGKTANIRYIADNTKDASKGRLLSMKTDTERTLFYDFLPLALGKVGNFNVRFHLFSVPGQIFYESSRNLLLKGVDGLVFVADSSRNRYEANIESMNDLVKHLHMNEIDISDIPMVIQYNKRNVDSALEVKELSQAINKVNAPEYEAVANEGQGVYETLKGISKILIANLKHQMPQETTQNIEST